MKFLHSMVGSAALLSACAASLAATPATPPVSAKKQLSSCMNKQMSASRSVSYYGAMKVCREMLKDDSLIASNAAKPAHAR